MYKKLAELLAEHVMGSPDDLEGMEDFYKVELPDYDQLDIEESLDILAELTKDFEAAIVKATKKLN